MGGFGSFYKGEKRKKKKESLEKEALQIKRAILKQFMRK